MMPSRFLDLGLVQPFLMSALDPPPAASVAHAVAATPTRTRCVCARNGSSELKSFFSQVQLLQAIGAMNEEQALSPLGYHLAKLPVPPKVLVVVAGEVLMWLLH
jgi:hypothetical protein